MSRIRAFLTIIIITAIFTVPALADTTQDLRDALKARGLTITSSERRGAGALYTVDGSVGQFTVEALTDLSENSVRQAFFLLDSITGWKTLKALSTVISIKGTDVRARVIPQQFSDSSMDLIKYVPSGLAFSVSGNYVDYEFRVKVDSYFLRFEGRLTGERAFINRLVSAIKKPTDFIRDSDPEYALNRIVELDRAFELLNEQFKMSQERLARTQAELETLTIEVSRIPSMEAEIQRLSGLEEPQNRIARAAMASLSKGFFSAAQAPSEEVIARSVALKTETSALTAEDILAKLKAEGLEANQKQVKAILSVIFGEY
ncbi:hypothetical protein MASR2M78_09330 [Treponema sp.]